MRHSALLTHIQKRDRSGQDKDGTYSATYSATYSYLANSPLVSQVALRSNSFAAMTTTKQYDYLNRLLSISSLPSTQTQDPISFSYLYNDANRRTRCTEPDGSFWIYEYDKLGQLTSGKHYWSDHAPVAGQQFEYSYDAIGNRTSTKEGGDSGPGDEAFRWELQAQMSEPVGEHHFGPERQENAEEKAELLVRAAAAAGDDGAAEVDRHAVADGGVDVSEQPALLGTPREPIRKAKANSDQTRNRPLHVCTKSCVQTRQVGCERQ